MNPYVKYLSTGFSLTISFLNKLKVVDYFVIIGTDFKIFFFLAQTGLELTRLFHPTEFEKYFQSASSQEFCLSCPSPEYSHDILS